MTTNYKETTVAGTSWQRARRIIIENPESQLPTMTIVEERVTTLADGRKLIEPVRNLQVTFDPANPKHLALYQTLDEDFYVPLREAADTGVVPEELI